MSPFKCVQQHYYNQLIYYIIREKLITWEKSGFCFILIETCFYPYNKLAGRSLTIIQIKALGQLFGIRIEI